MGEKKDLCHNTKYKMYDQMSLKNQLVIGETKKAIRRKSCLSKVLRLIRLIRVSIVTLLVTKIQS